MTYKALQSEVIKQLRNGAAKSDIYKELKEICNEDDLRKILASRPSNKMEPSYKHLHKIVCWIWVLFSIIELLNAMTIITAFEIKYLIRFIIAMYITVQLWRFNGNSYLPAIFWFIGNIFFTITELFSLSSLGENDELLEGIGIGYIVILLIGVLLMIVIRKKVFGYYVGFTPGRNDQHQIIFENDQNYTPHK